MLTLEPRTMYKALMETTVVGFFAMVACGASPAGPSQTNLTVTRLAPNIRMPLDSGIERETLSVIKDQAAWKALWDKIYANQSPAPPLPEVDFTKEMIVVAAAGQKPSSGYAMTVSSAVEANGEVTVSIDAVSPGAKCIGLTVITSPLDLARVTRRDSPVRFNVTRRTRDC
jgi:hypothetical protein